MLGQRAPHTKHDVNLWIVPLRMSIAAVVLFAVTMTPDMLAAYHVIHLPDWFSMGGIDDARAILSAMMGCVSTVLALIFSVALLVLSMVANLFGPRLLYRFVQDWVTQATIGLFLGAFIYVFLVFLVTHSDGHSTFIPQVSLITSWFLVLAAFSFLVFYSHRIAVSIQNPDAVARIVEDLRMAIRVADPRGSSHPRDGRLGWDDALFPASDSAGVLSPMSGYLQEIDHGALIAAAARAGARIDIPFRPGQFVLQGETLARISPAASKTELLPAMQRAVILGHHRILLQDLEFGIAQIVEIAIRALSPAVNDTFTGIACVDLLGDAILLLAESPRCDGLWHAEDGTLRVRVRPLLIPRLIKQAFDQIRQAGADNPAILIRLLTTLGRLSPRLSLAGERDALRDQAAAVHETAMAQISVTMDREDVEAAWSKTRDRLAPAAKA